MRQAAKFLSGSVLTYIVIAACSVGGGQNPTPGKSVDGTGGMAAAVTVTSAGGGDGGVTSGPSGTEGTSTEGTSMGSVGGNEARDAGMMATITGAITDPVPDAQADPAESGSRLKARYMVGEDGSRSFVGWYDSTRDENCTFQLADDGVVRCLPLFVGIPIYYADSVCSQRLFQGPEGCDAAYGYEGEASSCGYKYRLFALSPAQPSTVYLLSGDNCTAVSAVPDIPLYTGTPVSATEFVAGDEEVDS